MTHWQQLTPPTRLLCTIISVFFIALTPNGKWLTWAIYGLGVLIIIYLSRVSLVTLLQRVVIELAFVGVIILGTLFREGGTVLWSWGLLQITTVGLIILASVTLKVFLSLMMLNILILTTSIPELLSALIAIKTPPLLVAIMASMYRYIHVLQREFMTMYRAASSRNLLLSPRTTRLVIGNMMGSLFIRTYERGEKVYQSMLARGYQGLPPVDTISPYKKRDILAFGITGSITLLGQLVYL